jgi:hypothetical protein
MRLELLALRLVGDTRHCRNSNRLPSHALKRFLAGLPLFQILR